MEIYIGRNSGFCFGVERAITKALEFRKNGRVVTLGYIIHNKDAIKKLKEEGIDVIEDVDEEILYGAKVVVRTHGVKKNILEKIKKFDYFDATCPFVIRSQRIVEKMDSMGYDIVIFGDKNHPEVIGVSSYARKPYVVSSVDEAENLPIMKKVAVVSQTTQRFEDFMEVVKKVAEKSFEIRVFNTVCEVTYFAQKETEDISKISDVVIVVGGKMSSNTDKLYKVAKKYNDNVYKIENESEIREEFVVGKRKIGLVAGTSTPNWVIEGVIKRLEEILGERANINFIGEKNRYSAESILQIDL